MAYDFRSAGFELTNLVIELYRTRTYRRAAEEMSKNMLQSSVTAGQLISAVQDYSGAEEAAAAEKAMRSLDDMVYVISMMKRMGVYPAKALSPVMKLARTIKARLIDIVVENRSPSQSPEKGSKSKKAKPEQISQGQAAQSYQSAQGAQAVSSQPAQNAQNAVAQPAQSFQPQSVQTSSQEFVDEDGFYDDATEYL